MPGVRVQVRLAGAVRPVVGTGWVGHPEMFRVSQSGAMSQSCQVTPNCAGEGRLHSLFGYTAGSRAYTPGSDDDRGHVLWPIVRIWKHVSANDNHPRALVQVDACDHDHATTQGFVRRKYLGK